MAVIFALEQLFDDVVARLSAKGVDVASHFGWREPTRAKLTESRIVWVPGDPSGSLGEALPAKRVGENPRQLGQLAELFSVQIAGCSPTDPENERAQYNATRVLFDEWFAAAKRAGGGHLGIKSASWIVDLKERRRGAAIVVVATIDTPLVDEPIAVVTDATASAAVTELDVTENVTTQEPTP